MQTCNFRFLVLPLMTLLSSAFIFMPLVGQQIATGYQVAKWYQFKQAAISYTFDDNTPKQITVALPLFDQYGFKATLFTVTSPTWYLAANWAGLKTAAANGHEIGNHTVSHGDLNTQTIAAQENEYSQAQTKIETEITTSKNVTIAYPSCKIGDKATLAKYFIAGRICSQVINSSSPTDFLNISSITGGVNGINTAQGFNDRVVLATTTEGWCVFMFHGLDTESGYSTIQSSVLSSHLSYMNTNKSNYWVGTFGNVAKYIKQRNAASVAEVVVDADHLEVNVTDGLDNTIYNVPITVRRVLPNNWTNATVTLGGVTVASRIATVGLQQYVVFDAVPDQGTITLIKSTDPVSNAITDNNRSKLTFSPNPFSETLHIELDQAFQYMIYTLDGRLIEQGENQCNAEVGSTLASGVYYLIVKTETETYSEKIVKS